MKKTALILVVFVSLAVFSFSQMIIQNPKSSSVWFKGSTYPIRWDWQGSNNITYFKIYLWNYQITKEIMRIVPKAQNDGRYDWRIPLDIQDGKYVIRFVSHNKCYGNSEIFEIRNREIKRLHSALSIRPLIKSVSFLPSSNFEGGYPGRKVVLNGKNFGANPGSVILSGRRLPRGKLSLSNVKWESQSQVSGFIPFSVEGLPVQDVFLILIRDDGRKSGGFKIKISGIVQ